MSKSTKAPTKPNKAKPKAAKVQPARPIVPAEAAAPLPDVETPATEITLTSTSSDTKAKSKDVVPDPSKKLSALDAAVKVLTEAGTPLNTKAIAESMAAKGYWSSPGGKTPAATLYSAILREIDTRKDQSRFRKAAKGLFEARGT